jgi:predicted DNA-binding transcriptional regulator AlpA
MADPLLTMPEAAERLHKPIDTLRYWRQKGIGPPSFRLGRRVMYRLVDCEAYIAECYAAEHSAAGKPPVA